MLYAQDRWGVLLIFQAMDAAGKDSAIKHVMSGINPQGCQVVSFKAPSAEELDHDFLWRCQPGTCPERGRIGIFNRSYYEEVLVVRVHPELLAKPEAAREARRPRTSGRSASGTSAPSSATSRGNGTVVRKFFLHVSRKEQKKRFLERIDEPDEELEVLRGRRAGARALEGLHAGLRGHDPQHRDEGRPLVRRARRTTSGSRGRSSPRRSWRRWPRWTSTIRRSTRRSAPSSRAPASFSSPRSRRRIQAGAMR